MSRLDAALAQLRTLEEPLRRERDPAPVDARALLIVTLAYSLAVLSFPRGSVSSLWPMAIYPLWLTSRGGLPRALFAAALAASLPIVLLTGAIEPWLGTHPPWQLGPWTVSGGWLVLGALLLRSLLLVAALTATVGTLGLREVCAALIALGVPRPFAEQLLLLQRHLLVLLEEGQRITTAWRLRAGPRRRLALRTYGVLAGQWLLRSLHRAQRVHLAMQARGWRGALPPRRWPRWRTRDVAFVAAWTIGFVALRHADLPQRIGQALLGA